MPVPEKSDVQQTRGDSPGQCQNPRIGSLEHFFLSGRENFVKSATIGLSNLNFLAFPAFARKISAR
jgi:hypothetical protein